MRPEVEVLPVGDDMEHQSHGDDPYPPRPAEPSVGEEEHDDIDDDHRVRMQKVRTHATSIGVEDGTG